MLHVLENGCEWRALPERHGPWNTVCRRWGRWSKNGVMVRVHQELARIGVIEGQGDTVSLDSTLVKVRPDGTGALKNGARSIGRSCGGWTTKAHMIAASASAAVNFPLSGGQAGDAPEGRNSWRRLR